MRLKVDKYLLIAGVSLLPVYAFSSGGVQPAHLTLAAFAGLLLLRNGIPRTTWSILLVILSAHVLTVEMYYSLDGITYSHRGRTYLPMINGAFYFFNYLISAALYIYCRRSGLAEVSIGVLFAATIALATVLIAGVDLQSIDVYGRSTGSFNNPNQLGFFSVCLLSITYLLYRQGHLSYIIATGLFCAALFLSVASLSRAAVFSNLIVFFFALMPRMSRKAVYFWGVAVVVLISLLLWLSARGAFDDFAFVERYNASINEADSSLEGRGYFALLQADAAQLVFGLGQQNIHRIVGNEVHSTVASVLNTYGLVGLTLFGSVLVLWGKRLWSRFGIVGLLCIAGPAMLYGITHNGTRFTFFWLLFAASLAAASTRERVSYSPQSLRVRFSGPKTQIG